METELMDDNDGLVLVTGGAGFVGFHLVEQLLRDGYRVRVLDACLYGQADVAARMSHPNLEFEFGDICNIRDMLHACRGVDTVIALAALVGDPACEIDPYETQAINIESTRLLCSVARLMPSIRRVVFASSCSVYGATDGLILNEGSKLNPVSTYANTRITSEEILMHELRDRSVTILRLATLFGASPRMRLDLMLNTMTSHAVHNGRIHVTGGEAWRPHLHCRDAAAAFALAATADSEAVSGEIFNVGSEVNNLTITEGAQLVASLVPGAQIEHGDRVEDARSYRVSFDKIQYVLGFEPATPLVAGVEEVRDMLLEQEHDWKHPRYSNVGWLREHGLRRDAPHEIGGRAAVAG